MHFIVTGGSGFIGSHITEQLLVDGHKVTVVDNLTTGSLKNLPEDRNLKILKKNILTCDPDDFASQVDGIAHLAATPSVTQSWLQPFDIHQNNLSATMRVIQLCRDLNIPRLVIASSAAVYGEQATVPTSEAQEARPISPYGLQKLVSEQYGSLFAKQFGFSFIGLRLFNVFGERQLPNSEYSGVISLFTAAMRNNQPITVYGDGQQTRDFVYVQDVANAFIKALTIPMSSGSSAICNIGIGRSISLNELISCLKQNFPNWKAGIRFAPARLGDIQHSQADIRKAISKIGFFPSWSVQAGLSKLIGTSFVNENQPIFIRQ